MYYRLACIPTGSYSVVNDHATSPSPHAVVLDCGNSHYNKAPYTHYTFIHRTNKQSKRNLVRKRSEQSAQHNRQRNKFRPTNESHSTRYLAVGNNSLNVIKRNNKME
jgi:hypothetical protein